MQNFVYHHQKAINNIEPHWRMIKKSIKIVSINPDVESYNPNSWKDARGGLLIQDQSRLHFKAWS